MKRIVYPFVLLMIFLFASCESNTTDPVNENPVVPLNKAAEQLVESSNNFTFDIFSELEKKYSDENIFFSPLSMSMALSMAFNAGNGETKQQIKDVIDFGNFTDQEINEAFKILQSAFSNLDSKVDISMANSAWYKENYTLLNDYRDILADYYFAEIAGLDFADARSVDIINDWIADKTRDKITNMISELDPSTVLVLVNAIYFNGSWKYEFDEEKTYDGYFNGLDNSMLECAMMESGKFKTKYHVDENICMAALPYGEGKFEMVLYMETSDASISETLNNLDANILSDLLDNATEDSICVHMPKFKIETETFSIKQMLMNLGMEIPFTGAADFSNIFGEGYDILINDVLHKAFIEVNEEGTEAAAATVVIFYETSAGGGGNEEVILYFNKPFVFLIREISSGEILFAGKLVKPEFEE